MLFNFTISFHSLSLRISSENGREIAEIPESNWVPQGYEPQLDTDLPPATKNKIAMLYITTPPPTESKYYEKNSLFVQNRHEIQ